MSSFKLGNLSIDAVGYGISGNAILGIKESGKSYAATLMAEHLFDAGIPFIAFDPVGIWRFMRVPGKGRGYPIVVAGGEDGDLPLTVTGAPEIVRAAMRNGVSLVIDLFDIKLSKADWRRIVTACVRVLLHENKPHGMRHVFLEEAAEFVPQKVLDGEVYAAVEKLARMGGNSRLGYTLINPRSQEVNKAILELCENVFLFRQRGKNALENMDKWLAVAGATEQKEIIASMPDLPTGECWAWIGGDKPRPPMLVKVPTKQSFHPDRRVMRGDKDAKVKKAVDVGTFVEGMKSTLVKVEEEDRANNPKLLRAEIARLTAELNKKPGAKAAPDKDALKAAEQRGFERAQKKLAKAGNKVAVEVILAGLGDLKNELMPLVQLIDRKIVEARQFKFELEKEIEFTPSPAPRPAPAPAPRPALVPRAKPAAVPDGDGSITRPRQQILDAIAWMASIGTPHVPREIVAFLADQSPNSSGFANNLGALRSSGLIDYPSGGLVALTADGHAIAIPPEEAPTHEALMSKIAAKLPHPQMRIIEEAVRVYPEAIERAQLAEASEQSANSSGYANNLGRLRTLGLITYPSGGMVRADERLFPVGLAA